MPTVQVCLQWAAVVFNAFTLIIGILATLAGAYDLLHKLEEGSAEHIDIEKIVQLSIAGTLILAAIIGCSGAFLGSIKVLVVVSYKPSFYLPPLLTLHSQHLALLGLLIGAHGWKLTNYNETKQQDTTEVFVMGIWMKELAHPGAMYQLQRRYECCGDKGYADYTSLKLKVPPSCFHTEDGVHALNPYPDGCMKVVKRDHLKLYRLEKWTHIGLISYEIVGIILAITLSCQLTTKTRRYAY
ncbi:hypothetical protein KR093_008852 [Drosophila rubida]|uniref:Tetraspanin n=1 Tax=Drosophila rubida TaxID=30044 RepID=A0AAD4K215_9MUSC|nr:hypothetical protein KR093_008852 [Drosophila rubida]